MKCDCGKTMTLTGTTNKMECYQCKHCGFSYNVPIEKIKIPLLTTEQLIQIEKRYGHSNNGGGFKQGNTPWNKGKK